MLDIFGNDTVSSVNELHISKLDDNTYMMDKLGAKIKEIDETLYNTTIDSKIWDLKTEISSLPTTLIDFNQENYETPEYGEKQEPEGDGSYVAPEESNHEGREIHTSQDRSEDRVVWVKYDDAGRTVRKLESGKYEVFKPNGCADFYDSERNLTGSIC